MPLPLDQTQPYPALHECRLADFSPFLGRADVVAFQQTRAPHTPREHLARIVETLSARGFTPYFREHLVMEGLAVVNVIVPGLERFMLITDGILVVPGERGLRVRREGVPAVLPVEPHGRAVLPEVRPRGRVR